jgi:hypothetical protein
MANDFITRGNGLFEAGRNARGLPLEGRLSSASAGWLLGMVLLFLVLAPVAPAQQPILKPQDFKPLTERPWGDPAKSDATAVIERIFLEPDFYIRYSVLNSYLGVVPLDQFGKAFDAAIRMDGRHEPDDLVALMLGIWGKRDPVSAFQRVEQLFDLVGIEGWLEYDSWLDDQVITVQNHEAIKKSRFWLDRYTLASFAYGADLSELKSDEKRRLLDSFDTKWLFRFGDLPMHGQREDLRKPPDLIDVFDTGRFPDTGGDQREQLSAEIAARKKLVANPGDAPRIIDEIHAQSWCDDPQSPRRQAKVSPEFLLLWSKLDAAGMRKWAEGKQTWSDEAWLAQCIMFHQVDEESRSEWVKEVPEDKKLRALVDLAPWEPEFAMEEALRTKDPEIISGVFQSSVDDIAVSNAVHGGLDFLSRFDLSRLPKEALEPTLGDSATYVLEEWGDVDIGGCARFGIRCLKNSPWVKWEDLRKLFEGDSRFAEDGNVVDRTFCALRVWAVVRPDEMKAWIATEPDPELRKSLTWLLEHPWGTHPEP